MVLPFWKKEISSIHAAAFLIGAAGFLSRILGLFRDRLLASHYGASRTLDIYYASFQIPDFLYTLFLIGAASAAILPTFISIWERDKKKAEEFIGGLLIIFSLAAALVSLIVAIFAPFIVRLVAPGFDPASRALMITMTRIMMISPIFLGVSNIFSSVIQANRQFIVFALTSILYNLGIIIGILAFVPVFGPQGLAYGVILGAFLHMAVQIPALGALSFRPQFLSFKKIPEIKNVFLVSIPRVAALSLDQIISVMLVALASTLAAGSVAVFRLADNLRFIPVGIFGVSYSVAGFSRLAEHAAKKSKEGFFEDLSALIESILFWVVPLACFLLILRAHVVRLALGAGHFSWVDTRLTAATLAILAFAIIGESLATLFIRSFYAIGNTKLPFFTSLFTTVFVIGLAPFLLTLFTTHRASGKLIADLLKVGDLHDVGVLGLALAFALGDLLDLIFLWVALSRESKKYFGGGGIPLKTLASGLKIIFASIAATFIGYGVLYLLSLYIPLDTFLHVLLQGGATFMVAAAFYTGIMYMLGSEQVNAFIEPFRRRLIKPAILPQEIDEDRAAFR
ncbi:MAG: murein biosynthesis integral membrane protein MurJ [Candidatus Sungbacteria bacterium]|uniref:Probable lipid II flippase MurJ n=1 Tax=Candidatus Sungiibacteriota bacterium TaxID=2750080 RepID=A0A9D6LRN6_9BACT|nr:murein biosynthesis integral membrane protein MurJ [Candidatus Sungbacteria bacterium]